MTAPADHPIALDGAPLLVGREREQAMLHDLLTAALARRGSLVLIGGEAGIGKTALVEALEREAEAQGALIFIGRCYDLTETPPYGPWVELFGRYRSMNGLPPLPTAFAERGTVGKVTSAAALFHQVQDFLSAIAASRPVILFLDDLHWADPASLDLLRFLARGLAAQPILVIATYRTDELTRRHALYALLPVLVRETSTARLDLHPLRPDDLAALVMYRYSYHLAESDAARLVAYLHERSEGNPFFLGELLRTLEEEGTLHTVDSAWHLDDLTRVRVPTLLRQVIDGRLARLGEEAQRLLTVAAVIGQEVPLALWASVAETDEQALMIAVERAVDAHLLNETPDGMRARFVHALIREALYESVLPSWRRMQHRQVAEALSSLPDPDPDAVAYHFQQAGDARAVAWLITAGERAQRAYALLTATERYETALTMIEGTNGPAGERGWLLYRLALLHRLNDLGRSIVCLDKASVIAATIGDPTLDAATLFVGAFMRANHGIGDKDVVLRDLAAGVDALEALSPADYARLNAADGLPQAADNRTWRGTLIMHLALAGHYAEVIAMGERFVATTKPPKDGGAARGFAYGGALLGLGIAYAMLGRPDEAGQNFMCARESFQSVSTGTNVAQALTYHLRYTLLPYQSDHLTERQRFASTAMQANEQAQESGIGTGVPFGQMAALLVEGRWGDVLARIGNPRDYKHGTMRLTMMSFLGLLLRAQGEPTAAWELVREMLPSGHATEPGSTTFDLAVDAQRLATLLALDEGDLTTARAWIEAHDRFLAWNGAVLGLSEKHLLWAQYHRAGGDPEAAYHSAEQALVHATEPRQPLALIAAHRLIGELDTDAGRFEQATAHLDTALALAGACAAPYERALTLLALAELRVAMGQRAETQTALDEARAICIPLGAKPALARADRIAARITPTKRPLVAYPAGLSAREVEVLRLVAAGLTDMQVAEQLFLSPRTVGQHLRSIYNKLGVSSRTAASSFAVAHDLT